MGQAKQRGTFEERKAAAVDRDRKLAEARAEIKRRRPSPKLSRTATVALAVSGGVNVGTIGHMPIFAPGDRRLYR